MSILSAESPFITNAREGNPPYTTHTAKSLYQKFETNILGKGIARLQSQYPHSYVRERFIYSHKSICLFCFKKYVDRSWEYINRSQTHGYGKEIHKLDFRCSVPYFDAQILCRRTTKSKFAP